MDQRSILQALEGGGLTTETANEMVENAIGTLGMPLGLAIGVQVNGRDYDVPMAIEEPSVIARRVARRQANSKCWWLSG